MWSHEAEAIILRVRWEGGRVSALIGVFACAAFACGNEDGPEPNAACEPSAPPQVPTEVPGMVRGSVTVLDRSDFTLDDQGKPRSDVQGRIAATFADFSAVTSTKSGLTPLGDTCVGTISRPTQSGDLVRLDLDTLVVTGLSAGDVHPMRTGPGVYTAVQASLLLQGANSIRVTGTEASGGFPAFDEMLTGIAPLEVMTPKSDGTAELTVDDLPVEWTAGNGDYVVVTVSPKESMSDGGVVTCFVQDDGCFILPAAATTFLLAAQTPQYTLSVERHRHRSVRLQPETTLEIEVVAEHRATLVNGVIGP